MRRSWWHVLIAIGLAVAGTGCGGGTDKHDEATVPAAGDVGDPGGGDPDTEGDDGGGAGAIGSCDDIGPEVLDQFAPGLELDESASEPGAMDELACQWEVPAGDDGAITLFLQVYDGAQFYGEDGFEETEVTPVEVCDRAFVSEDFGLSLQILNGEQVLMLGATQTLVPDDECLSDEEGVEALVDVATAITGC